MGNGGVLFLSGSALRRAGRHSEHPTREGLTPHRRLKHGQVAETWMSASPTAGRQRRPRATLSLSRCRDRWFKLDRTRAHSLSNAARIDPFIVASLVGYSNVAQPCRSARAIHTRGVMADQARIVRLQDKGQDALSHERTRV